MPARPRTTCAAAVATPHRRFAPEAASSRPADGLFVLLPRLESSTRYRQRRTLHRNRECPPAPSRAATAINPHSPTSALTAVQFNQVSTRSPIAGALAKPASPCDLAETFRFTLPNIGAWIMRYDL
ncbi:MAG TPA: hypothetical protein VFK91_04070, partial [Methyloceanibacter sp.]|nr:hypothetical protein [Methyloceanibacter sp.]